MHDWMQGFGIFLPIFPSPLEGEGLRVRGKFNTSSIMGQEDARSTRSLRWHWQPLSCRLTLNPGEGNFLQLRSQVPRHIHYRKAINFQTRSERSKMTWPTILGSSVIASIIVFLANRVHESMAKDKKALGMLSGILLEIDYAEKCARAYLNDSENNPVWSPAYRIVVDFCQSSIPWLATEHKLRRNEVAIIHHFYICATEMTRCLEALADQSADIQSNPGKFPAAVREQSRLRVKCDNLIQASLTARAAVKSARKNIDPTIELDEGT